jgi:hypothetical protein
VDPALFTSTCSCPPAARARTAAASARHAASVVRSAGRLVHVPVCHEGAWCWLETEARLGV